MTQRDLDSLATRSIPNWESDRLLSAECVVFWIPRDKHELLGLNTNLELGIMLGLTAGQERSKRANRLFIGWPDGADRMVLPSHYAAEHPVTGGLTIYRNLNKLCQAVATR